jgi:hemerythrin-like metal-binding protein
MQWQDEYSIGIKEIDSQHQELVRLFLQITESVAAELDWSEIHLRILQLGRFAEFHFKFEDALMRVFAYPESVEHAVFHEQFFAKLKVIEESAIVDEVRHDMVKLLLDWLSGHILVADKAYAKFILGGAAVVRS